VSLGNAAGDINKAREIADIARKALSEAALKVELREQKITVPGTQEGEFHPEAFIGRRG
jgi:hypothetical protein